MVTLAALDNFRAALERSIDRYRAMDEAAFVEACLSICGEGPDFDLGNATFGSILLERAQAGSIDAAAALIAMNADHETVVAALGGIAERSADLTRDLQIDALATMLEEHMEEEFAAGRATFTVDPVTGRKLWRTVEPGGGAS